MENTNELLFKTMHQLVLEEGGDGWGGIVVRDILPNRTYKTIANDFKRWQLKETNDFWNKIFENEDNIVFMNDQESIMFTNKEELCNPPYAEFKFVI